MKNTQGKYNIIIKLPDESRRLIMNGKKTTIARNIRHGFVGDRFRVGNHWYEITKIEKMTVKDVCERHFKTEGRKDPDEFKRTWTMNHHTSQWNPDGTIYLHYFKKVERGNATGVEVGDSFKIKMIRDV